MEQEQILNKALPYVADGRMNHMSFELLFGNYNISEKMKSFRFSLIIKFI